MIKETLKKWIPWKNEYKKIYKIYTKSHNLVVRNHHFLAEAYAYKISKKYRCYISPDAKIGKGLFLPHPIGVIIGAGVTIGINATIYQNVTLGRKNKDLYEYPTIGNDVIIYSNSTVVGNIKIGNNVIIGCNSVVLRDVKDGETVCGIVK